MCRTRLVPLAETHMDASKSRGSWSRTWDHLVSDELTEALTRLGQVRRLNDGAALYQRGAPGTELYGVQAGFIRLAAAGADGQEGIVGLYGPGTWFGEVSFFDEGPRPTDAYAIGNTEVRVVSAAKLRTVLDAHPEWYRDFARVLCNKLRLALGHIEGTWLATSVRVALRLLDLLQAYGTPEGAATRIDLKLPQEALGRMLGLTRQSVNKELRGFEARGWLAIRRGQLVVRDPAALRQHVCTGGGGHLLVG